MLDTVCDNLDPFQGFAVTFKHDCVLGTGVDSESNRLVTDTGNRYLRSVGNSENEISIKVRNGTVVCTLLKNACTYDFIAIGVLDVSRNRSLCGCGQSRAQNACKSKHDSEMDLHYWLKFGDILKII